jgi:hypothetical protein
LLHMPIGIEIDPAGNLYFSDVYNSRIRKINDVVLSVADHNSNTASKILMFPNLGKGPFNLIMKDQKKGRLEIFNVTGQMIYSSEIISEITKIDLEEQKGIYFYRFLHQDKTISTGKLIITE